MKLAIDGTAVSKADDALNKAKAKVEADASSKDAGLKAREVVSQDVV